MNIKIKEVRQIKITELLDLDPITVYMDEWEKEETDGTTRYQGRITIVCYDTAKVLLFYHSRKTSLYVVQHVFG